MNPVTLAPPGGSARNRQSTQSYNRQMSAQSGRFQLSEYGDSVSRQNRREDLLLSRRLSVLERQRSQSQATIRKSFQRTERFIDSVLITDIAAAKQSSPTLTQYDQWRRLSRYNYGTHPGVTNGGGGEGVDENKKTDRRPGVMSRSDTPRLSARGDESGSNSNRESMTTPRPSNKLTSRSVSAVGLPNIVSKQDGDNTNTFTTKFPNRRFTVNIDDDNDDAVFTPLPLPLQRGRRSVIF